jgi:hypothetical protein
MGNVIGSVKYADEFVLLAKEETVLRGVIDRRIEIGRCCGTKMNVGRTEVMGISRQPIPGHIMVDQTRLENMEYFNCFGSTVRNCNKVYMGKQIQECYDQSSIQPA